MENDDRLPLSYISQYGYCPRRAALLMNEQQWNENEYTAEGRAEHERVHTARVERRKGFLKLYDFYVWSDTLMLSGKCDCIEAVQDDSGALLEGEGERYALYPIEYKHGKLRQEKEYMLQLCAQAMCLEEMYQVRISEGALFYIDGHQRLPIPLTDALRSETVQTAEKLRRCWLERTMPSANESAKCKKCSMKDICMPGLKSSASTYCKNLLNELRGDCQ